MPMVKIFMHFFLANFLPHPQATSSLKYMRNDHHIGVIIKLHRSNSKFGGKTGGYFEAT